MECELDRISLYYEIVGEGKAILMLHGMPTDHRQMVPSRSAQDSTRTNRSARAASRMRSVAWTRSPA
jgi:hypothetical protein